MLIGLTLKGRQSRRWDKKLVLAYLHQEGFQRKRADVVARLGGEELGKELDAVGEVVVWVRRRLEVSSSRWMKAE